ncbi:hypothetical protein DFH07DRAFT_923964 [Mycena maculata]|uniref:RanBP2-type domain-containing protein n=1 Tax=Mycena maculata TaxID=230809 RepID=A0AAD7N5U0_9AGAR|nr:hypothetical protein DFH07DRAFT_923964 [Mycena maculata]
MSGVVRSHPRRSAARSAASLPYARPKPTAAKKSPWSIATGLLNYLNPLRLRSNSRSLSPIDVDDDEEPQSDSQSDESPPESLSARGRQMAHNPTAPARPPMEQQVPSLLPDSSSPKKNLDTVAAFLEQRRGQTISPLEAEGLISLIHKSTPAEEKPEPFRFSTSASLPSTPTRGNSPADPNDIFTLGASSSTSVLGGSSPRKTLAKNPNGVYRWSGGGSARPSKNRYASPAFGTPSRATPERLVFRDSPAQSDASPKRRRLETPAATPPPVPRSAAPGPSPNRIAASQYFPFPLSNTRASSPISGSPGATASTTTPARSTIIKVQTAPANPSPLRQAWGGSPASSVSSNGSSPAQGTPTKAAALLSALIRDADAAAPPKSADVRNPYQSASPVSVRVTNTHPPEAASRKRVRATGRPAERKAREAKEKEEKAAKEEKEREEKEKKEKEKEALLPQAIIEATLPKGSKRSRPPAHFNASASLNSLAAPSVPAPRRSPRLEPQRIEADVDADTDAGEKDKEEREAGAPAAKRARLPAVIGNAVVNDSASNGAADAPKKDAEAAPAPAPAPASTTFSSASSASTPSGFNSNGFTLGNGTSALGVRLGPKPMATSSAPKEPSKLRYSFQPPPTPPPVADKPKDKNLFPMDPPPPPQPKAPAASKAAMTQDPKDVARAMARSSLPAFVFTVLTNAPRLDHSKARDAARRLDKGKLPTFDFTAPAPDKGKGRAHEAAPAREGFNWAAAGAPPPKPASAPGSWTCGTCMLLNGPDVKDKCTVCETARPGAVKAPVQAFNWAAAGAPPPKPANGPGPWTCGTCMLMNGPDVKDKCAVCDSARG